GLLSSRFKVEDKQVTVTSAVHPDFDLLAVAIESKLIGAGELAVRFAFPYGSPEMQAADWTQPDRHRSEILAQARGSGRIHRAFETDEYQVAIAWTSEASFEQEKAHEFLLAPTKHSQNRIEFVVLWSAPAERSGDGAMDRHPEEETPNNPKRRRRFALPAPPARSTGKDFGAKARRSIFPRVATRARRSSSGAWFYRNISPPFSVQAQCRRRKPD
ncbi:MAG: hypothetical protein DMF71_19590, partial [Acidobacteria bacterium]